VGPLPPVHVKVTLEPVRKGLQQRQLAVYYRRLESKMEIPANTVFHAHTLAFPEHGGVFQGMG
jgi:hypothetical protein